jgi:hypothetical protein
MYVIGDLKRSHISTTLMPEVFGRELDIPMNLKQDKYVKLYIWGSLADPNSLNPDTGFFMTPDPDPDPGGCHFNIFDFSAHSFS